MGVEFQAVSPASKGLLRTCLHAVARGPAEAPAQTKETPRPGPAPAETPPATAEEATARLQRISAELRSLESALTATNSDHRVLREFRDAVDQVRVTAWSVQKWRELESERSDPYAVLPRLVNERIRRATQLSTDVTQDLDAEELEIDREGLEELANAVDRLHERLSRIFRHLRKK
jgi:small-conductance mechanosensitive channel